MSKKAKTDLPAPEQALDQVLDRQLDQALDQALGLNEPQILDREPQWEEFITEPGWTPDEQTLDQLSEAEIVQGREDLVFTATNWSEPEDSFSAAFYDKYRSQLWFPEEIPLMNDVVVWDSLSPAERLAYSRASAGLNALDTLQGEVGMPTLHGMVRGHVRKATLQLQGMMEDVHARSYSLMNKSFLSVSDERAIFEWIQRQPQLQFKVRVILSVMHQPHSGPLSLWKKMAISCMLETALFYSGFFYPLYLAGQGKMMSAGEIFNLIILDESAHGVYVSMLAKEVWEEMSDDERALAQRWYRRTCELLYRNEVAYSEAVYDDIGLTGEVKRYVRYNFNVLSDNLGLERLFEDQEINPVVKNGLSLKSTTHDFFSSKGNSYAKINVAGLRDSDVEAVWDVADLSGAGPR